MTGLVAEEIKLALASLTDQLFSNKISDILKFSKFAEKTFSSYPSQIVELIESGDLIGIYDAEKLNNKIRQSVFNISEPDEFNKSIRLIRNIEMSRIVLRELAGIADIEESMRDLSSLADALVAVTTEKHSNWLTQRYGNPVNKASKEVAGFNVFAMGKLGGCELNFSSDIDLIFAYSDIGETNGEKSISNNEFFIKLGHNIIHSLNNTTAEGFVYRVDMRLRPNGQSGPLVMSFAATENYYQIHGREWERYAWIKARTIAGDQQIGVGFLQQMRPFIYRKYLDYQVYESLEEMKGMINKEIRQQGMQQNIKLGRGGIREIEFIAQSHQLVRGGREPQLRTRSLKKALFSLVASQQTECETVDKLYQAYLFLRSVEHRLQMKNDQQTHLLPDNQHELTDLADSLGYALCDFEYELITHRNFVHAEFLKLHGQSENKAIKNDWHLLWRYMVDDNQQIEQLHFDKEFLDSIKSYAGSKVYRALESKGRQILDQLMPKILQLTQESENPQQTLNRTLAVLSAIGGRTAYLSLLDQFPQAAKQLIQLCAASPWISKWIADHPIVLDTLINPRADLYIFNNDLNKQINNRIEDETDEELKHDILRQIHHSSILQIAIADLQNQYSAAEIRLFISQTAQVIVNQVVKLCQLELKPKFGLPQSIDDADYFGVIAYGKLGSKELAYNADLDLVFVYDDQVLIETTKGGRKSVRVDYYFSRLVQRIVTMLSMQISAGKLYDIDTRLRPSGQSGLLVSSFTQYSKYQKEKAWTWEHQALVKARLISDAPNLGEKFDQLRTQILSIKRTENDLKKEITSMRKRMQAADKNKSNFKQKNHPGGMIDIEFICQYFVLNFAHQYESLTRRRSVQEILEFVIDTNLLKQKDGELLACTYSNLLQLENQHKLHNSVSESNLEASNSNMRKVQNCWDKILE